MEPEFTAAEIVAATKEVVRIAEVESCYIRPLMYLGYGEMGLNPLPSRTEVMVACWPWGLYLGPEAMANGCRAMTSSWQHINQNSIAPQGKGTGQYVNSSLSKVAALKAGYDEAVLLSPAGNVVQGTGENIFIVQGRTVVTPPIQEGLLAGITRDSVMTIARDHGYEVVEHALVRTDLYMADEAFFTGTAAEIVPIASVDDRQVAPASPARSAGHHRDLLGRHPRRDRPLQGVERVRRRVGRDARNRATGRHTRGVLTDVWPLFGLVLRTPRLELRVPSLEQLAAALAALAEEGVHDPAEMPFLVPWTDLPPGPRGRSVMQYQWRTWSELSPDRWRLELVVLAEGRPGGPAGPRRPGLRGHPRSGDRLLAGPSPPGSRHRHRDAGRRAAPRLRRSGRRLGGLLALSGNAASIGVSRKLGYARRRHRGAGRPRAAPDDQRFRIDRETWAARRPSRYGSRDWSRAGSCSARSARPPPPSPEPEYRPVDRVGEQQRQQRPGADRRDGDRQHEGDQQDPHGRQRRRLVDPVVDLRPVPAAVPGAGGPTRTSRAG